MSKTLVAPSAHDRSTKDFRQIKSGVFVFITLLVFLPIVACKPTYSSVAISPSMQTLAVHDGFSLTVYTLFDVNGKITAMPTSGLTRFTGISCLEFSPDGSVLAIGSTVFSVEEEIPVAEIVLMEPLTGKILSTIPFGKQKQIDTILAMAFSPDGKILATGSFDQGIQIFDISRAEEVKTFILPRGPTFALAFSPDGQVLAGTYGGETIGLWDLITGEERFIFHEKGIHLAYAFDGKTIAIGTTDGQAKLYDTTSGKMMLAIQAHPKNLQGLEFHPTESLLATSGKDGVKLWNIITGQEIGSWDYPAFSMVFSQDGKSLFVSDGKGIKTIDLSVFADQLRQSYKVRYKRMSFSCSSFAAQHALPADAACGGAAEAPAVGQALA